MERINVNVSDLCLWETNPRVEPSIDQMDELNKIYNFSAQSQSTSKRQLMNLASSIAEPCCGISAEHSEQSGHRCFR